MPRKAKGARLVWRAESRKADGSVRNAAGWFIRDGNTFIGACGGTGDRERAEKQLAQYIAEKYTPAREHGREPNQVLIADAVNVYLADVAPGHAAPSETAARLDRILDFFGKGRCSDITDEKCRKYAAQPGLTQSAARRQLEDLRAAINHYHAKGCLTAAPSIMLPPKPEARGDWLTRDEAASLIRTAWRMRQSWKGRPTSRRTGQHIARFILVALYTGTRSAAVCSAAMRPVEGRGFVDLDHGVFYRRWRGANATKKRQPAVRLPDRLLAHLRRWASTDMPGSKGRKIAENHVVEWNGKPVRSIKKGFLAARKAAGLGPEVTPHILRHTAATWLMQTGTDPWQAAGFLGMSVEVLLETYGHHHPDFQLEAANNITKKYAAAHLPKNVVMPTDKQNRNIMPYPTVSPQKRRN